MSILDDSFYPAIRQALHTSVTESVLPDEMIGLDIYLGAAEAEVLRLDPDAESRTGAELVRVQNAAVLMCASYLAPAVEVVQSEYIPGGGYRYQKPAVDWTKRASSLRSRAEQELSVLLAPADPVQAVRPTFFGKAGRV